MQLNPSTRVGPYEIVGTLGAGGMGEVYRATDTKLKRQVAIKVLPAALAADPDRLARFQREAEALASLNHPHIAQIYGLEDDGAIRAIVMELVEGPTLGDRIAAGAVPLDEALTIALQITHALEAAHERGIIHRDLKPANIKVRADGTVKVLDFGLAKLTGPAEAGHYGDDRGVRLQSDLSLSPTITSPVMATGVGTLLGTATYMSPEQARGKAVDRRADIWAFGCVLFEMLTGRRAFAGGDVTEIIASVIKTEVDWTQLPAATPASIRRLLRRCLQKDPVRRLHDIADARLELEDAHASDDGVSAPAPRRRAAWQTLGPWAVAGVAAIAAVWALLRPGTVETGVDTAVRRMELNLPDGVELFVSSTRTVAVSPDGSRIAFVGNFKGTRRVFVRPLDVFEATPIEGSDGATSCFFSPDGLSIGFITAAGTLRVVSLADGVVVTIADTVSFLLGSSWGQNGIVFVRGETLWETPPTGGTARQLTMLGGPSKDTQHAWPNVLPDGKIVLFGVRSGDRAHIEALDLASGKRQVVVERGTLPLYSTSGHLMFFRDGALLAAKFDLANLRLAGPAVSAISGLPAGVSGVPVVDASASGTVAYAPTAAVSRMVWVTRDGAEQFVGQEIRNYANPRLSPRGDRVLVQAGDLWVQDLTRGTFTRLSQRMDLENGFPIWAPDGQSVLFRSSIGIRTLDASGSGKEQTLAGTSEWDYPSSITPDGKTLIMQRRTSEETSFDTYAVPLSEPLAVRPLLNTPSYEGGARLSPDGRWFTYVSNESGRNEIYLRPYEGEDRRWQVSTSGGTQAIWNPNGKEIVYREGDRFMSVDLVTSPAVSLSQPRQLFEQRYAFGSGITIPNFDMSSDGQRFLMIKDEATAGRLHVVMNWFGDLTRRAPADTP
jgi:Tol biopolymer transport system component